MTVKPLGSVATFTKGKMVKTAPVQENDELPYLTIDVMEGGSPQFGKSSLGVKSEDEDVLVVADGSRSGLVFFGQNGLVASTVLRIRTDKQFLSGKYLYYLSQHRGWQGNNYRKGSTVPHFDYTKAASEPLELPELIGQDRVVQLLTEVDNSMSLTQKIIDQAYQLKKGLLQKLITAQDRQRVPLKSVIEKLTTGVSARSEDRLIKDEGEIGVLKISAVTYLTFDPDKHKVVDKDQVFRMAQQVKAGTILVSRANTPELVGACVYVNSDYPYLYLPDKLWELRTKDGVSASYINYVLQAIYMSGIAGSLATGTSRSMQNISQEKYMNLEIPIASFDEQTSAAEAISAVEDKIAFNKDLLSKQAQLKKGLMQDLFYKEVSV